MSTQPTSQPPEDLPIFTSGGEIADGLEDGIIPLVRVVDDETPPIHTEGGLIFDLPAHKVTKRGKTRSELDLMG